MKPTKTFPMKRTCYIEFINKNKVVIGTPYKRKEFQIEKEGIYHVNLVTLEKYKHIDNLSFFAEIDIENVNNDNRQLIINN
jgi:hypothetical protein